MKRMSSTACFRTLITTCSVSANATHTKSFMVSSDYKLRSTLCRLSKGNDRICDEARRRRAEECNNDRIGRRNRIF